MGLTGKLSSLFGTAAFNRIVGLGLLVAFLVVRLWDPLPLELVRLKTFDLYQVVAPRAKEAQHRVLIVDIDEESLARYGQWPWPRTLIARLVENIAGGGAVAIAFDVIFAEADRMSPANVTKAVPQLPQTVKDELARLPSNDERLAAVMKRTRVVLGQSGYHRGVKQKRAGKATAAPLATLGPDPRPYLFEFPALVRNIDVLEQAAAGRGLVTIIPERDGIVRRVPLIMKVANQVWPALSLELLRVATGTSTLLVRADEAGIKDVVVGRAAIPTDSHGRIWVHFDRHDRSRYVSAGAILADPDSARRLAGRLVVIGTSATGLFDIKATPLDAAIPGAEIHAQILENVLSGHHLVRPGYAIAAEMFLAIFVGLLIIALAPRLGAGPVLGLGFTIALIVAGVSYWLFIEKAIVFDVVYPLMSSFVVFAAMVFLNYLREERQRRQIRGAFGQYLSPALVEQLARDPDKLVLGGETRELTILFCDVRGFTTISETFKDNPQGLTRLINRLLTPLSNVVMNNQGTIDKYMGDNIMAFWNAPLSDERHAARACRSALAMLDALKALNEERQREASEGEEAPMPIHIGIGVNTGECVVGNIGSDVRFDYSVLGDTVNLASRLEGQTKAYGVDTILGETTARAVADEFATLAIDDIRVKGKSEPETIYALVGDRSTAEDGDFARLKAAHDAMRAAYKAQQWSKAEKARKTCAGLAEKFAISGLYGLYGERIKAFRANPPGKGWDGVYMAETK